MLEQPAFGRRLKELRLARRMSQAALAGNGLSTGYLSRLESGARPPTSRVVKLLADRLGVPASTFEPTGPPALGQLLAAVTSATSANGRGDASTTALTTALTEALRADDEHHPALRWQAVWFLAKLYGARGAHDEQHRMLTELVALSDELASAELRARALAELSRCLRIQGNYSVARRSALEAYELAGELPLSDQAAVLQALISAEAEAGWLAEAGAHADELLALTDNAAGTLLVEALWASATVRSRQGDFDGARLALERALRILDSHDDLALWMRLRLAAASLYLRATPPLAEQARALLAEVDSVVELVGTELHWQERLLLGAHLAFAEGDFDEARRLSAQVDDADLKLSFQDAVRFRALRGQLLIVGGEVEEGTRLLRELAQQAQAVLNVELAADLWRTLANCLVWTYDNHESA